MSDKNDSPKPPPKKDQRDGVRKIEPERPWPPPPPPGKTKTENS